MTSPTAPDPLVALWQATPGRETDNLLLEVRHQILLHQRLSRSVWAIMCGVGALLIFEEATGGVASRGALSALWLLTLVIGALLHRRALYRRTAALTLDTASLLASMIAEARSDLFMARCLYAGVPLGALAGYVIAARAGLGGSPWAHYSPLHMLQLGAGIAALVIMVVVGLLLARSRRLQVRELGEKLKLIQADL